MTALLWYLCCLTIQDAFHLGVITVICVCLAFEDAFHPGPHIITDPSEKSDNLTLDDTQTDDIVSDLGQKPTDTKPPDKKDKVSINAFRSCEWWVHR